MDKKVEAFTLFTNSTIPQDSRLNNQDICRMLKHAYKLQENYIWPGLNTHLFELDPPLSNITKVKEVY